MKVAALWPTLAAVCLVLLETSSYVACRLLIRYSLFYAPGRWRRCGAFPSYAPFHDSSHPGGALDITVAILAAFVQEAEARGQRPLVVVIPDIADLKGLRAGNPAPCSPLLQALHTKGIDALDAATGLNRHLGEQNPCSIYTADSRGHLNAEGNAVLARLVADRPRPVRGAIGDAAENAPKVVGFPSREWATRPSP